MKAGAGREPLEIETIEVKIFKSQTEDEIAKANIDDIELNNIEANINNIVLVSIAYSAEFSPCWRGIRAQHISVAFSQPRMVVEMKDHLCSMVGADFARPDSDQMPIFLI